MCQAVASTAWPLATPLSHTVIEPPRPTNPLQVQACSKLSDGRACLPLPRLQTLNSFTYPWNLCPKDKALFLQRLFDSNNITHLFCTDFYSCRIDNPVGDTRSQGLRRLRLSKLGFDAPVTPTAFLPSVTSPAAATIFPSEFVRSISKQTAVLPTDNAVSL